MIGTATSAPIAPVTVANVAQVVQMGVYDRAHFALTRTTRPDRDLRLLLVPGASAEKGRTHLALSPPTAATLPSERSIIVIPTPSRTRATEPMQTQHRQERAVFEEERNYFDQHKAALLRDFSGKYIAIVDERVVDSDPDSGQLAIRVYKRFGYKAIYMPYVCEKPRVLRIPSPRIAKKG